MPTQLQHQLTQFLLQANRNAANALVDNWAKDHSYEESISRLLEPALNAFGAVWASSDNVSLAQGYMAGKIAEDIMKKVYEEQKDNNAPDETKKGPVVVGNIEDDYHSLGRKLVATFLRADGWEVVDMGNDVPAEEFVDKALETGAKVIGVSAMMHVNALNIKKLRQEIDRRGLTGRLQLAVGGAIFVLRPKLVAETGGDGTARNALQTPALMEKLWRQAEEAEETTL